MKTLSKRQTTQKEETPQQDRDTGSETPSSAGRAHCLIPRDSSEGLHSTAASGTALLVLPSTGPAREESLLLVGGLETLSFYCWQWWRTPGASRRLRSPNRSSQATLNSAGTPSCTALREGRVSPKNHSPVIRSHNFPESLGMLGNYKQVHQKTCLRF